MLIEFVDVSILFWMGFTNEEWERVKHDAKIMLYNSVYTKLYTEKLLLEMNTSISEFYLIAAVWRWQFIRAIQKKTDIFLPCMLHSFVEQIVRTQLNGNLMISKNAAKQNAYTAVNTLPNSIAIAAMIWVMIKIWERKNCIKCESIFNKVVMHFKQNASWAQLIHMQFEATISRYTVWYMQTNTYVWLQANVCPVSYYY